MVMDARQNTHYSKHSLLLIEQERKKEEMHQKQAQRCGFSLRTVTPLHRLAITVSISTELSAR